MIAYIIGYISLVIVPILCIWYVTRTLGGIPKFWTVLKRGAIIMPFAIFLISVPIAKSFVKLGLYPTEIIDLPDIIAKSFWGAGLPEEICKILSVVVLAVWNRRKGMSVDIIHVIMCICMVGSLFGMYENLIQHYTHIGMFSSRHWAFVGHFCYSIMMGYGVMEFMKSHRDRLAYIRVAFWCFVLPIFMHMIYDICPFGLQTYTQFRIQVMFLFGSVCVFAANIWIAYKCLKKMRLIMIEKSQIHPL